MKRILTVTVVLALLLLGSISISRIGSYSESRQANVVLSFDGVTSNISQPLLVKNTGSTPVLYYIYDEGSGLHSGAFAVGPNSTQRIDPKFSRSFGTVQLLALDYTTKLPISNAINRTVTGQMIIGVSISVVTEICHHQGDCLLNFKVLVSTSSATPYNGILTDNRGDPARIVGSSGILQTGGVQRETILVYIIVGETRSNTLLVTF